MARRKAALRHGGDRRRVTLEESHRISESPEGLLDLDDALTRFASVEPEQAKLVELRFFAGQSVNEAAAVLGISPATAPRRAARTATSSCAGQISTRERRSRPNRSMASSVNRRGSPGKSLAPPTFTSPSMRTRLVRSRVVGLPMYVVHAFTDRPFAGNPLRDAGERYWSRDLFAREQVV